MIGMKENMSRLRSSRYAWYRQAYRTPRSSEFSGKVVCCYLEQGLGDNIQMMRYFPKLRESCDRLFLHAPEPLIPLLGDYECIPKGELPPEHDCHVLSMSLPFLFAADNSPYIRGIEPTPLPGFEDSYKIGIAWEGSPDHAGNDLRCCPLSRFAPLFDIPNAKVFMLQKEVVNPRLVSGAEDFELYSSEMNSLRDVASLMSSMDAIVSVDTAILHLAGAMGKLNSFGLISCPGDQRWKVSRWYDSLTLVPQKVSGSWEEEIAKIARFLGRGEVSAGGWVGIPREKVQPSKSILITGGLGDVLAMERYFSQSHRDKLEKIYLATPADNLLRELFKDWRVECISLWEDFSAGAFFSKEDLSLAILEARGDFPEDWVSVEDWSIRRKFAEIELGMLDRGRSSFLGKTPGVRIAGEYDIVFPATENFERTRNRNVDAKDWESIRDWLSRRGTTGVILGKTPISFDKSGMVDLIGSTSLEDSIGLLAGARGYIGVDSFLSVLASDLFAPRDMRVKSKNPHLDRWKRIYFGGDDFSFMRKNLWT